MTDSTLPGLFVAKYDGRTIPPSAAFRKVDPVEVTTKAISFNSSQKCETDSLLVILTKSASPICVSARVEQCDEGTCDEETIYVVRCQLLERLESANKP